MSWRLVKADIGKAARAPFEPDPDLPRGMARVTPSRLVLLLLVGGVGCGGPLLALLVVLLVRGRKTGGEGGDRGEPFQGGR